MGAYVYKTKPSRAAYTGRLNNPETAKRRTRHMSRNAENALLLVTGTMLLGFSMLGIHAAGEMERLFGAFCSQSWVAAGFAAVTALAGAASFLSIR